MKLHDVGLEAGQEVRYRRFPSSRWATGRVTGINKDGSITLYDGDRMRAIPTDRIEVAVDGPRGGRTWTPLTTGDTT